MYWLFLNNLQGCERVVFKKCYVTYKYSKTVFISLLWIISSYVQALKVLNVCAILVIWQTSIIKFIFILIPKWMLVIACCRPSFLKILLNHMMKGDIAAQKYHIELSILSMVEKNHHFEQHFINFELKLIIFTWGKSLCSDMKPF